MRKHVKFIQSCCECDELCILHKKAHINERYFCEKVGRILGYYDQCMIPEWCPLEKISEDLDK